MNWYAVYLVTTGALVSLTTTLPVGLDPAYGFAAIAQQPDETHVWDPVSTSLVTVTARPDTPFGVFSQELTAAGWTWYYLVGPVAFQAKAASATQSAQPTVNAAKTYAAANSTDEQFHTALTWLLNYRDRLAASLSAAGISPPTVNARYNKCQTLAAVIGEML